MDHLNLISGLALVIFLAFVELVVIAMKPNNTEVMPAKVPRQPRTAQWQTWFGFIIISLVIAIWTLPGALFFLIIVWLVRLHPRQGSSFSLSDKEKKSARGIYAWLLFSPILTIPVYIALLIGSSYYASSADFRVLAAIIPWVFHLPVLVGLTSKNAFIFRHTQQAILLLAVRAAITIVASNIGGSSDNGYWLFLLGNGSLWLFGSIWGSSQVNRGECWWMEQNGEKIVSPESAITITPQMDQELEDLLKSLNTQDKIAAKSKALRTFRSGTPETRNRAVEVLSKLGEVETF